jgi:hypothetical protein
MSPRSTEPGWPRWLGILSIVFGSLMILNGCFGALYMSLVGTFAQMFENMPNGDQFVGMYDALDESKGIAIAEMLVRMGLGVMLLISGIDLTARRRRGVRLSRVWAVVRLLLIGLAVPLQVVMSRDQLDATMDAVKEAGMPTSMESMFGAFTVVAVGIQVVWQAWYPIFLLIWLRRPRVKEYWQSWA